MRPIVCFACNSALPSQSTYCPHCGRPVADSFTDSPSENLPLMEELSEIGLNQLAAADYILIETRNNLYKFVLVEPSSGYGILSGGTLGNQQFQGRLLGTICCKKAKSICHPLTLKVGMNALFYLDQIGNPQTSGESKGQVTTSPITRLTRVGGGKITRVRASIADAGSKGNLAESAQP